MRRSGSSQPARQFQPVSSHPPLFYSCIPQSSGIESSDAKNLKIKKNSIVGTRNTSHIRIHAYVVLFEQFYLPAGRFGSPECIALSNYIAHAPMHPLESISQLRLCGVPQPARRRGRLLRYARTILRGIETQYPMGQKSSVFCLAL